MSYESIKLGATEHEWVWQSNDPIFPAIYCWHDGKWWYATKDGPYWRESSAGASEVTNDHAGFTAKAWMTEAIFEFGSFQQIPT